MTGCLRSFMMSLQVLSFGILQAQQSPADTGFAGMANERAVLVYDAFTGPQSRIYNGKEDMGYLPMKGQPYFDTVQVQKGSILYEGVLYRDVPMLYDLVRGQVIVEDPRGYRLVLTNEWIKEFTLNGHHFMNTPTGFYDLLCAGAVSLMVKRQKILVETIEDMQVMRHIEDHTRYFIVRDGTYHPIDNWHALLALLRDKKKEINEDLKKKKIKYRKSPEAAIEEAADYYNHSSHQ